MSANIVGAPVSKVEKCPVCERKDRVLTKHEVGDTTFWSCADTEFCYRVAMSLEAAKAPDDFFIGAIKKLFGEGSV